MNNNDLTITKFIFYILIITNCSFSQNIGGIIILPNGMERKVKDSETFTALTVKDNSVIINKCIDLNEDQRIIVEFINKPECLRKSNDYLNKMNIKNEHEEFKNKLNNIVLSSIFKKKVTSFSRDYNITNEYFKVFNGLSMECKQGLVDIINKMPMVKRVYKDNIVEINLTNSVSQIHADQVHDSLGYTGKGIIIGIIDTGIDYTHSALGGGFGSGYKVISGYDFVNDDDDPIDDHSHGTHVAGIIAANNDSIVGVAPDVSLLAVKVLDSEGFGYDSDVIAGIEYCFDPDQNPLTDDGADILNMSIGGPVSLYNPLDSVINYVSEAGMLCVVAAGNSGNESFVSTPGTAKEALTVGACDIDYNLAPFSSSGPEPINNYLKPEVIAPGVNIKSSVLNNAYELNSGTSMATPHVTGVAALLKEQYPDLSGKDIKNLIVNNTQNPTNIEENVYYVGNGCIDAFKASQSSLVASSTLSFGITDNDLEVWKDTTTFLIKNINNLEQNIELSISEISNENISLNISTNSFILSPYEEKEITAEIVVPASVPILNKSPFTHYGKIMCSSDIDTITVPFGFVKSTSIILEFDLIPVFACLYDAETKEEHLITVEDMGMLIYRLNIPEGIYNLFSIMKEDSSYYIVEMQNIEVYDFNKVYVSHNDAEFNVWGEQLYDSEDKPLENDSLLYRDVTIQQLKHYGLLPKILFINFNSLNSNIFTTKIDSNFNINRFKIFGSTNIMNVFFDNDNGIESQEDYLMPNGSDNLFTYNLKFEYPIMQDSLELDKPLISLGSAYQGFESEYQGFGTEYQLFLNKFNNKKISINKTFDKFNVNNYFYYRFGIHQAKEMSKFGQGNNFSYITPRIRVNNIGKMEWFHGIPNGIKYSECNLDQLISKCKFLPGDTLIINPNQEVKFPMHIYFQRYLYDNTIFFLDGYIDFPGCYITTPSGIQEVSFIYNQFMDYSLYSNGKIYSNNNWIQDEIFPTLEIEDDKTYKLVGISPEYYINGQRGKTVTEHIFKFEELFKVDIPTILNYKIEVDGKIVSKVNPGDNAIIDLLTYDYRQNIKEVDIFLITSEGNKIQLDYKETQKGIRYEAIIPNDLPEEFIDIRISLSDSSGFLTDFTASPGFYFGSGNDISYESRMQLIKYKMKNPEKFPFYIGDTVNFELTYENIGNATADSIFLELPESCTFEIVQNNMKFDESLEENEECHFTVNMVLKENYMTDTNFVYIPEINWKTNNKQFMRKHSILFNSWKKGFVAIEKEIIPYEYKLCDNYPNPFNATTNIKFELPNNDIVKISIFDIRGKLVRTLVNRSYSPGYHSEIWNGRNKDGLDVSSGIYFYQISTKNGFLKNSKMILLK